jgi:uncharacterized protein YciI
MRRILQISRLARLVSFVLALPLAVSAASAARADDARSAPATNPAYDEALATAAGADDYGMHNYVLVILKSGPTPVPAGPERDAMFRGHFANIKRLAAEGKLVLAGPFDGAGDWRGMFVFDVAEIADAEALVATDPVIQHGEMVAECHKYYGSAALHFVNETHAKLAKKSI